MQTETQETPRDAILRVAKELGLSMTSEFVPFSQSRNKSEKHPSLNWKVTLLIGHGKVEGSRAILTTDYGAGSAHCPSYKQGDRSQDGANLVQWECENGYSAMIAPGTNHIGKRFNSKPIKPDMADVLHSLSMDSDVLDAGTFEEWASNFGYETDSRKAEAIYRACLDIALKLRNALGESGLQRLREACQDY